MSSFSVLLIDFYDVWRIAGSGLFARRGWGVFMRIGWDRVVWMLGLSRCDKKFLDRVRTWRLLVLGLLQGGPTGLILF